MDCLDVRGRLAEHALATLPREESAFVDRHLEWCAGCRKEADELAEGAAVLGLATTDGHRPPEGLEEQVVRRVRAAAGGPPRRRRSWVVAAVGAAAAVAAIAVATSAILSWRTVQADLGDAQERVDEAERRAEQLTEQIQRIFEEFRAEEPPPGPREVALETTLSPVGGRQGGAGALVYMRPQRQDWALVVVGGLPRSEGPYRVVLRDDYGNVLKVQRIYRLDADGGATAFREFDRDLRPFRYVQVINVLGTVVLQGTLDAGTSASPTNTPTIPG